MHPADTNLVGFLALAMCGAGLVVALLFFGFVGAVISKSRLLPPNRTRLAYWLGMVVLAPLTFAAFALLPGALKALAVIASFGWDSYADGLRVVNKHGLLSDGRYLGVFWSAAIGGWIMSLAFVIVTPVTIWHLHFTRHK